MRELQKMIRHLDNGAHAPIETDVNQLLGGRTSTEYATALLDIGIRAQVYVIVMRDTLELPDTLLAIRRVKGTNVRKTLIREAVQLGMGCQRLEEPPLPPWLRV